MDLKRFEELEKLINDYDACWAEVFRAHKASGELIGTVRDRIEHDRQATTERIQSLRDQIADPEKSETVRRISQIELQALEGKTFQITEEEREVIEEEIGKGKKALSDARAINITEALREAKRELETVRANVFNGKDPELAKRWLDASENELSKM